MKKPRRCEFEFHTTGENTIIDWDEYAMALERYIDDLELRHKRLLALDDPDFIYCKECGVNEAYDEEERCRGCADSALPNLDSDLPF